MAFKYRGGSRTTEDVSRRSKESSGSYDNYMKPGTPKFKPREGENRLRIMPPPDFGSSERGKEKQEAYLDKWGPNWEIMAFLHRNVGSDEATYLCPKHMKSKPCVVCEAREEMTAEEADELRVQKRPFCWVIDRDNEKAGPMVWDMPMGLFRDLNLRSQDKRNGGVIYIDHPEEGFDIMFTREGTGKKTKYVAVEVDRDPSPIHDSETKMQRWLEFVTANPLPSILNFYDPDHVEKVLMGASKKRDEDDEDEEAPARRRRKPVDDDDEDEAPKKKRKPADDDDDEDEAPKRRRKPADDDEDEDEPAPKKKRKPAEEDEDDEDEPAPRKRKKPADEDEDEDEDAPPRRRKKVDEDEDEDEDPAPRRKKKPAADEDDEDEDEAPRRKKKPAADEDEDEDEDEETTVAARRKAARLKRKRSAK